MVNYQTFHNFFVFLSIKNSSSNSNHSTNLVLQRNGSITLCGIFSSPGHCPGWTVIGNSVCLSVCMSVTGSRAAHRQVRPKSILYLQNRLDLTMLKIFKKHVGHLGFLRKRHKTSFFQLFLSIQATYKADFL